MTVLQVRAVWTGFSGAPGYTNLYFQSAGAALDAEIAQESAHSFFTELRELLPIGTVIAIDQESQVLDEASGVLVDYDRAATAQPTILGSATGAYSAPSGAVISWTTSTINRGRRMRGRTFVVPLGNGAYEANGTLSPGTVAVLIGAAQELAPAGGDTGFGVWSRPVAGAGGAFGPATGFSVPDMAAILRSRRD